MRAGILPALARIPVAWLVFAVFSSALAQAPAAAPVPAQGSVQVAFPPWDDAEGMIVDAIRGAQRQILVQAFSFTSRNIANALLAAKRRGIDVRVLADREQSLAKDRVRVHELAAGGIPVSLEYRYQNAHNKVMIIDVELASAAVITGSYNWTYAAQNRNAENVLILRGNVNIARTYAANWHRHAKDASPYAGDPAR